jgi:hypothetical protein
MTAIQIATTQIRRERASRRNPRKKLTIAEMAIMPIITKSTQFTTAPIVYRRGMGAF